MHGRCGNETARLVPKSKRPTNKKRPCPLCIIASSNIEMYMMGMGKENVESGVSRAERKGTFP
ncbi:hypothetical protein M405DRAFT_833997 [Rhizopogon salebrosus TDB-379]|nr:hypothetical protein M405DRAFT_833997 [Rhizopogon salebrosus TDB-379]